MGVGFKTMRRKEGTYKKPTPQQLHTPHHPQRTKAKQQQQAFPAVWDRLIAMLASSDTSDNLSHGQEALIYYCWVIIVFFIGIQILVYMCK
ncbi:hypothetical protein BDL97_13G117300 [Sphagnum fallax]|nr:hypothetical protein BDL97_13G117300 [Sphagnum fallax]